MNNKITIVLRHYSKRPRFLMRSLSTIKNQNFKKNIDFCILKMDSGEIPIDIGNKYNIFTSQLELQFFLDKNGTDYIAFIDDDDTWSPEYIKHLYTAFGKIEKDFPSVGAIACYSNIIYEAQELNHIRITRIEPINCHLDSGILSIDTLRYYDPLPISSCIFSYKKIKGIIDTYEIKSPGFFWLFCLEYFSKYDFWIYPEVLSFKHIREEEFGMVNNHSRYLTNSQVNLDRVKINSLLRGNNECLKMILERIVFSLGDK